MKRICVLAAIVLGASAAPALAGDFPGVGNPADWSDALPYYNRGNRYLTQGRNADAVRDFQEAITRYPDDPDFYINLGVALRKTENYKGAEAAFKTALKMKPKDWLAWNNLGNAYLKQDRLKDTLSAFEQALKCNPPAADKAALLRDIGDIHKLLRATGQEPMPTQPGTKVAVKTKAKPKVNSPKPSAAPGNSAPVPGSSIPPAGPAKDWGYE